MRFLTLCFFLVAIPFMATAQPRLQDATVVARDGTISITRLPVRTSTGTIFRDVTIELHVDDDGRVTLATDGAGRALVGGVAAARAGGRAVALRAVPSDAAIELPQRASPPIVMQRFTPGTYTMTDGTLVTLGERGEDLVHHVPMWTLSGGAPLESATFYSGPPSMNPRSARLKRAQITSTDLAYGTMDGGTGDKFGTGALIGVAQHGRILQIVSFRVGCCSDAETPVARIDLTYVGR